MKKWLTSLFATLLVFGVLLTPSAFAKSPQHGHGKVHQKASLVALGDSITYGYNLGDNTHPSTYAFPYVMGKDEGYNVTDLGVPGWTSTQLLNLIETDPITQQAIKHAKVVTIDIGNNDLLQGLAASQAQNDPTILAKAIIGMEENLSTIISDVQKQSHAKIVVYNIYNAFQVGTSMNTYSDQTLPSINTVIAQIVANHQSKKEFVGLANAFTAFEGNQASYVRLGDIHPTILGQEVLAHIGEQVLEKKDHDKAKDSTKADKDNGKGHTDNQKGEDTQD